MVLTCRLSCPVTVLWHFWRTQPPSWLGTRKSITRYFVSTRRELVLHIRQGKREHVRGFSARGVFEMGSPDSATADPYEGLMVYKESIGGGREITVVSDPGNTLGYSCGNGLWNAAVELLGFLAGEALSAIQSLCLG